ncbi:MAG: acetyl-CoA carboxylase biotin carboxylase subunit [Ruminococcaceae bacterium]|nr:acetyl-CoA carboxylase biotin carboxylase subunit [Oscillospiraceae bacterium]
MFRKILIANRGEIAVRIIRACRDMGIISVAVYSEADRESLHALIADEAICIGPAYSRDSYLNMNAILTAAKCVGADAIHPGYGFLSENTAFARLCEENGIEFIGPSSCSIELVGDKAEARRTVSAAGVPIVPGSEGVITSMEEAETIAASIGYPVMIKAANGGGGKGIRMVEKPDDLRLAFETARSEAKANFGDDGVYIEKFIRDPHHIEFQILADKAGNTIHLMERDCSMQRRHQKVLEETPSAFLTPELRERMGAASVAAAKAAGYYGAGTVEYLVDADRNFYFMEMNARIQVEHPVTEQLTGIDLVRAQIEIASGRSLRYTQEDVKPAGHVIECRINAENPLKGFAPCPGKITGFNVPGGLGVRIDAAVYQGYTVPPYYDSMIAKLIVTGRHRAEAITRMRRALAEFIIEGIDCNVDFQMALTGCREFVEGNYTNAFLDNTDIAGLMKE